MDLGYNVETKARFNTTAKKEGFVRQKNMDVKKSQIWVVWKQSMSSKNEGAVLQNTEIQTSENGIDVKNHTDA